MGQNYPNPVSSGTIIPYQIFTPGFVVIKVYNSIGRMVNIIVNEQQEIASYEVHLDAGELNTGIYFYTMVIDNTFVDAERMVIIK